MSQPIYQVGTHPVRKQAARRADGQWFYRIRSRTVEGYWATWGRWLPCKDRPDGAWYDPGFKKRANLPND